METPRTSRFPDLCAGLFVVGLGVMTLWQAGAIPASPLYAQVGPKAVPYAVAGCAPACSLSGSA